MIKIIEKKQKKKNLPYKRFDSLRTKDPKLKAK